MGAGTKPGTFLAKCGSGRGGPGVIRINKTGRQLRLKATTLDTYASAFEHALTDEAWRVLGAV
jgi:hypothetical protein